jgi:hypothetical protein
MPLSLSDRCASLCEMYSTSFSKSFQNLLGCLWIQIMMFQKLFRIIWNFYGVIIERKYVIVWIVDFWQSLSTIVIIYWITMEQMLKYHKVREKSKILQSHMISVYKYHIKNSSDFDKVLVHIPHKGIHDSHSSIWLSERYSLLWRMYSTIFSNK